MKILVFCTVSLKAASGSRSRARLIIEGLNIISKQVGVVTSGVPESFYQTSIKVYLQEPTTDWTQTLRKAAKDFEPDWIYGITEGAADSVIKISEEIGCKSAIDMHGIGIIEIIELGKNYGSRKNRLQNSYNWLISMTKANVITVANPNLFRIAKLIFPKPKVLPIFSMVDIDLFNPIGETLFIGKNPQKKQVLFIGSLYKWQGVNLYLDAIQKIQTISETFEFTLIGSTGRENETELSKKIDNSIEKINYYPSIDFNDVPKILRGIDIVVIPRPFMLSTYFALPQKLGEFMASGSCVVATNLPNHRWALGNPKCGFLCSPTSKGIANAILEANDSDRRTIFKKIAREIAEVQFSHINQTKKICSIFISY